MCVCLIVFKSLCVCVYMNVCIASFTHAHMCMHIHRKNVGQCWLVPTKPILLLEKPLNHLSDILCIVDAWHINE